MSAPKLRVTQIHSTIGRDRRQALVLRGLGLRHLHHEVVVPNTPAFRGMIRKVLHLVKVEECDG
ncbi:MAG: 50S ribosomal protein L30 [Myxococcales bacterium]|nr:50S ribosomal protein L30 [Myxococcales bacterium]